VNHDLDELYNKSKDLEANRAGALSQSQRDRLMHQAIYHRRSGKMVVLAVVFLIVLLGPILVCAYLTPLNRLDSGTAVLIGSFFSIFLVLAALNLLSFRRYHAIATEPTSRAEAIQGSVKIKYASGDDIWDSIWVGRIRVKTKHLAGIEGGKAYVVYYEPRSMELLSAERLGGEIIQYSDRMIC
jgi:hypothetical protein